MIFKLIEKYKKRAMKQKNWLVVDVLLDGNETVLKFNDNKLNFAIYPFHVGITIPTNTTPAPLSTELISIEDELISFWDSHKGIFISSLTNRAIKEFDFYVRSVDVLKSNILSNRIPLLLNYKAQIVIEEDAEGIFFSEMQKVVYATSKHTGANTL